MRRFLERVFATLIVFASRSFVFAQADAVDVNLKSTNFEFADTFVFEESGVLRTGGFESVATVSRLVPETITKKVPLTVVRIVNGRPVYETTYVDIQTIVYRLVYEQIPISLPSINGVWFGSGSSIWLIHSIGPSGVFIGAGKNTENPLTVSSLL